MIPDATVRFPMLKLLAGSHRYCDGINRRSFLQIGSLAIGGLLPHLAGMMSKLAIVRSIVGLRDEHSSYQTLTGYTMDLARREGRPNVCSVIARVLGPTSPIVPPFVDLFPTM